MRQASRIAKELVSLFARVGIPAEVLTDQGTNFMSAFVQELYRLLNITQIRTSPYHPQTDGLVEKFNGTLKAMLRKFTAANKKDWDEYLPYLLFAYREAPQESTKFSPFELLYGRHVRGPLDVLKEVWSGEESEGTTVVTHLVQTRERLNEMVQLMHENLQGAQQRQKRAYDKRVTVQPLAEGDEVLVLLPTRQNKLQLQWEGPFTVIRKVTEVDYEVKKPGRRQEKKIYHINLLKKWHRSLSALAVFTLRDQSDPGSEEEDLEEQPLQFLEVGLQQEPLSNESTSRLTAEQESEIRQLFQDFPDVTGAKLGRTSLAAHTVETGEAAPIRQPPYRVPLSQRESMKTELDKMLELGITRPSSSPWASPVVLAEKKDGGVRFCVDYRYRRFPDLMPTPCPVLKMFWNE